MNEEILREIIKQDYAKIRQDIQSFLKNKVLEKKSNGIVFGLSGGIDSITVAFLCSKIFEKKNSCVSNARFQCFTLKRGR